MNYTLYERYKMFMSRYFGLGIIDFNIRCNKITQKLRNTKGDKYADE